MQTQTALSFHLGFIAHFRTFAHTKGDTTFGAMALCPQAGHHFPSRLQDSCQSKIMPLHPSLADTFMPPPLPTPLTACHPLFWCRLIMHRGSTEKGAVWKPCAQLVPPPLLPLTADGVTWTVQLGLKNCVPESKVEKPAERGTRR
uniref:Uncharacterized protein n=1 Tax=Eutreptiella gymnastica TaxID=73025 RepID=A0A7S1I6T8_9EUGL